MTSGDDSGSVIPGSFPNSGVGRERPGKGVLRERFEAMKDTALDAAMKKGESWAKKVGYGDSGVKLDDIPALLSALGLKLVDVNMVCVPREEHRAYRTIAKIHLEQDWDEPT